VRGDLQPVEAAKNTKTIKQTINRKNRIMLFLIAENSPFE